MSIITFSGIRGQYIGVDAHGRLIRVGKPAQLFTLVEVSENKVALSPLAFPGIYIQAEDGGGGSLAATSGELGSDAMFTVVESESGFAFLAPDGIHYFRVSEEEDRNVTADGISIGAAEIFKIEHHGDEVLQGGHCCHPSAVLSENDEPLWNDATHEGIVVATVELLGSHTDVPSVEPLLELMRHAHFFTRDKGGLLKGLHDADYQARFHGGDYASHFYDPKVGRNFRHPWIYPNPNARTEGARYFNLSMGFLASILWKKKNAKPVTDEERRNCGYWLGIATHYLTDLAQPMHAANFGEYIGQNWPIPHYADSRHSNFEKSVERQVKKGYFKSLPALPSEALDLTGVKGPSHLIDETCGHARSVWDGLLGPISKEKFVYSSITRQWRTVPFTDAEVLRVMDRTLKSPAMTATARFFLYWHRMAEAQTNLLDMSRWYRFRIKGSDDYIHSGAGDHWVRRRAGKEDEIMHRFTRNQDGSYGLQCKARSSKVWTMVWVRTPEAQTIHPLELKDEESDAATQKFLPVLDEGDLWIFELNRHEPLRFREARYYDKHIVGWTPDIDKPHRFTLEDAGAVG